MAQAKTVLVTGAGTGFGRDVSFILAGQGYNVISAVETVSQIHDMREAAKKSGFPIRVEKLDITDENDRLRASAWDIDILVNNAGISEGGSLVDIPEEKLRDQFEVNVFGTILLTQKFAKSFIAKRSGKIVFISSVAGLTTDPFAGAYSATKHAIEAFAEALNKELQEFGIRIATVNPGPILTGFNDRMFEAPSHWYPEDQEDTAFDYSKLAFPHEQYDPRQVSELIAKVATGEVDTYRNLVPKEIEPEARKEMEEIWTRKVNSGPHRNKLVQKAYDIQPATPNGK